MEQDRDDFKMLTGKRTMEERNNTLQILTEKPIETGPLGRPRSRWVDKIGMNLTEASIITWN